jgi:hypothetical protein
MTAYTAVGSAQAKVLLNVTQDQLKSAKADLRQLQKFLSSGKGSQDVAVAAHQNALLTQTRILKLNKRIAALKKGFDIVEPHKVDPNRVAVQRPRLGLPPAYVVPSKSIVILAAKLVGQSARPVPGETTSSHQIRQRAILQRALVRVVAAQAANPTSSASALVPEAVVQTVAQDGEAIKAESQVAGPDGGVVPDPAAEAMDPVIDAAIGDAAPSDESSGSSPVLYLALAGAAAAAAKFMGFF